MPWRVDVALIGLCPFLSTLYRPVDCLDWKGIRVSDRSEVGFDDISSNFTGLRKNELVGESELNVLKSRAVCTEKAHADKTPVDNLLPWRARQFRLPSSTRLSAFNGVTKPN